MDRHRRDAMEADGGQGALHNMSAPPRSRITLSPLNVPDTVWHREPGPENRQARGTERAAGGLQWVMRIDLDQLIQRHFPHFVDSGPHGAWGATQEVAAQPLPAGQDGDEEANRYLRLRCCVAIARVIGRPSIASADVVTALVGVPHEHLCDELRDISSAIDVSRLDLPPLGLLIKADRRERPYETNAARVFYALSRLSGSTFVRDGSAMVSGQLCGNIQMDLLVPV